MIFILVLTITCAGGLAFTGPMASRCWAKFCVKYAKVVFSSCAYQDLQNCGPNGFNEGGTQPNSAIKEDKNCGKPCMTQAADCHGAFLVSFHFIPEGIQERLENYDVKLAPSHGRKSLFIFPCLLAMLRGGFDNQQKDCGTIAEVPRPYLQEGSAKDS